MSSQAIPADGFVRPVVVWTGTLPDAGKQAARPKSGVITGRETFAELWTAWELGKVTPLVNFDSHFVVVVAGTSVCVLAHLMVHANGDAGAVSKCATEQMEMGFGYSIGVFPRAGLEKCHGVTVARREE
jgi:hypothetical protein